MRKWIIIGALAVVIVFAAWWFWPVVSLDCSDVVHQESQNMESWRVIRTTHPYVSSTVSSDWGYRLFYKLDDGGQAYTDFYADVEDLDDVVNGLPMSGVQKDRAHHIIDCLKAGCPRCA